AMLSSGAVVLISHPSLTGISTGTGISGTTQWHNAVRARMYLHGVKAEKDQQPNSNLRLLEFLKNQYGPVSESITLEWQGGLYLPVGGATFDAATRRERAREVFIAILQRYEGEGRTASDRTGANYAPKLFAQEGEAREGMCTKEM